MKKSVLIKLSLFAFLLSIIFVTGCTTTAGPFVTGISSDGNGNLIIEKNMVEYNKFYGTLSVGDNPTSSTIRIDSKDDDE